MGPMADLTPQAFAEKWGKSKLSERSAYQQHFLDLCGMLGQPTPAEVDPEGDFYTFEKGVKKTGGSGGKGFADVWRKGFFAFEYKGKHKDLTAAYSQLLLYREDLENPPLLVVTDMDRFEVHTNFTGTVKKVYSFTNAELPRAENLSILRALFSEPRSLEPGKTREGVTQEVASKFAQLASGLRDRGEEPHRVAHFLMKLVFCLFAEDIDLLPEKMFTKLVENSVQTHERFPARARELFSAMAEGGEVNWTPIRHFNGGLFADDDALELTREEIRVLVEAARLDWSSVEPAIFGTLFERSLDPSKRSQLGAQYTDKPAILRIVEPVLMSPLRREWDEVRKEVEQLIEVQNPDHVLARGAVLAAETRRARRALSQAQERLDQFLSKLRGIQVLDPACGSGNFLYVSLNELLNLEKEVSVLAGRMGRPFFPEVNPKQLLGIELDPYARELAQVSVWIGYLQWMKENGFGSPEDPILGPMTNIREMNAILVKDGDAYTEPQWPEADVVVGNPPFLGSRRMRPVLGDEYCDGLLDVYAGRVEGLPDLVCYWFERARCLIEEGRLKRAGLIATQAIRNPANRKVLANIKTSGDIFMAWSDEPWVLDGADVRISMVGFDEGSEENKTLNGLPVASISSRLRENADVTEARELAENRHISFQGVVMRGPFDIDAETASTMLEAKGNPNGRPNSDVVKRRRNARDITQRSREGYAIDFGVDMPLEDAAEYEAPFAYVEENVYPERQKTKQALSREKWWIFWNPRPDMREALAPLSRYIVTPRVSKHRVFNWLDADVIPDTRLVVFAREDDYFFGVLHSKAHETWALDNIQRHGVGNDPTYNNGDCFENFPFPWSPGTEPEGNPQIVEVAEAARALVQKRDRWLEPEGVTDKELKKRTLTNLYNDRPPWLRLAHERLDRAVFAAYGWPEEIEDEEILKNLLALNLERST